MKNTKSKTILILLVLILALTFTSTNVNAKFSASKKSTGQHFISYYGNYEEYHLYRINGKDAFCITYDRCGVTTGKKVYNKKWLGMSKAQKEELNMIANVGYNSKRNSKAWYAATQQYIWNKLHKWGIKHNKLHARKYHITGWSDKEAKIKKGVKELKAQFNKKVSFDGKSKVWTMPNRSAWKLTDSNKKLSNYKVKSTPSGITAKITGNTLTVTPSANPEKGTIILTNEANKPVINSSASFYASGSQYLAHLGKVDSKEAKVKVDFKTKELKKGEIQLQKEILFSENADKSLFKNGEDEAKIDYTKIKFHFVADSDIKDVNGNVKYQKGDIIQDISCDQDGLISIKNILPGKYYLEEYEAPAGIVMNSSKIPITATKKSDGSVDVEADPNNPVMQEPVISTVNSEKIQALNIITTNVTDDDPMSEEEAIEKAQVSAKAIEFNNPENPDITQYTEGEDVSVTTDLSEVNFSEQGMNTIVFKTEKGTEISVLLYVNDPHADSADYESTIYNATTTVELSKTNITGSAEIEGAHLVVEDEKGNKVDEWTSEENKSHIIEGLEAGKTYKMTETIAPDNFVISKDSVEFTVQNNGSVQKHEMTNFSVGLKKIDEEGNLVNGAEIAIIDKETGETVEQFTTDYGTSEDRMGTNENVYFLSGLKEGKTYIAREIKAPVGYQVAKDIEFTPVKELAEQKVDISEEGVQESTDNDDPDDKEIVGDSDSDGDNDVIDDPDADGDNDVIDNPDADGDDEVIDDPDAEMDDEEEPEGYSGAGDITIVMEDKKIDIHTTAIDSDTKDHISNADAQITINDTVAYENLTVGKEYHVEGTLMDKKSGKPMRDDNGKVIKSKSETFIAKKPNGTVIIPFKFKGVTLKGKTTVAFETLYEDNIEVAVHKDIKDKDQTVRIPKIKTKANLSDNNKKVKDLVTYKNLIPGKKYEMKGWLVKSNGSKVSGTTVTKKFTAKKSNGKVVMTIPTKNAKGKLVVFEECRLKGKLVGEHKDLRDKHQTVNISEEEKPSPGTGDDTPWWIFGIIAGLAVIAGGTIVYKRRKGIDH